MAKLQQSSPVLSVRLFKTISRTTIDGKTAVSTRYQGKDESIDLLPFMQPGSSVRTSKSVREPAGGFVLTFADQPQKSIGSASVVLESVYGLVEPMDVVEIRAWGGVGERPTELPIVMRGFVSEVQRQQAVGEGGIPQRQVVVSGQDYGKIWQTFQVIYLASYAEGKALLTSFNMWDLYGIKVRTTMPASEFVRRMMKEIINPHIAGFMPKNSSMPKEIKSDESISVKHGVVNNSYQQQQGAIYDILRFHGDVGYWNELYTEDRNNGVYCVYRASPALKFASTKAANRKIQDDSPDPIYVPVRDEVVQSISTSRSDASVANFYWVNNSKFDLIDDVQRKLSAISSNSSSVSLKEYPNTAVKYYGVRAMYAETQQGEDTISDMTPGKDADQQEARSVKMESWISRRRRTLMEMNQDNVVLERGVAKVKGGLMRPDGKELMKAGDYARFQFGTFEWDAYVVQIDHEFVPWSNYTCSLTFERGEGFANRIIQESGGMQSPWLAEQATRGGV